MNTFHHISAVHGVTTRLGGVSKGVYAEMNTGIYGNDVRADMCENIRRALDIIGSDAPWIASAQQVHGDGITCLDSHLDLNAFEGYDTLGTALQTKRLCHLPHTDAIVSLREDVVLMVHHADCVPILLFDPHTHICAAVHSGWRGTAQGIVSKTVDVMVAKGADARILQAGIGPCAGACCYRVGPEVYEAFESGFSQSERAILFEPIVGEAAYLLDLKAANAMLLRRSGLAPERVVINGDCTICNPHRYHSYRRARGSERGSMSAFIQGKIR